MKSIKLILIATMFAATTLSNANADGFKNKPRFEKVVNMVIDHADQVPGLVAAIFVQVDVARLISNLEFPYLVQVYCRKNTYRIRGTRTQWIYFLRAHDKERKVFNLRLYNEQ
jgi:hypothetical protein